MSQLDLKEYTLKNLDQSMGFYVKDLEAMTDEACANKPNGVGRSAIDYTYEVAFVNRMISARMRGEEPAAWPWNDGWATAPEGYTRQQAIEDLKQSAGELRNAIEGMDESQLRQLTETPNGRITSPFDRANFAAMHMMYHDAQLNYCQAMNGDLDMHWV